MGWKNRSDCEYQIKTKKTGLRPVRNGTVRVRAGAGMQALAVPPLIHLFEIHPEIRRAKVCFNFGPLRGHLHAELKRHPIHASTQEVLKHAIRDGQFIGQCIGQCIGQSLNASATVASTSGGIGQFTYSRTSRTRGSNGVLGVLIGHNHSSSDGPYSSTSMSNARFAMRLTRSSGRRWNGMCERARLRPALCQHVPRRERGMACVRTRVRAHPP